LKDLSSDLKEQAKRIAGQILVDEINSSLDASRSPVRNGKFKTKKADGTTSRLFKEGDLRANISFEEGDGDYITVGIFDAAGDTETAKAFNHNTGDTVPQRRFIPAPNQVFKKPIMDKVNRAIKELKEAQREVEDQTSELVNQILDEI